MSQTASRPAVLVASYKKKIISMSVHMRHAFFLLCCFSVFAPFPKTADAENTNSFEREGMAFAATLLSKKSSVGSLCP